MTLAIPADIKKREDCHAIIERFIESIASVAVIRVWQGRELCFRPNVDETRSLASRLTGCSFVFVRNGSRGSMEPLAAFVGNQELGTCKLEYLIDVAADDTAIARRESDCKLFTGAYARMLFDQNTWVDRILAPFSWSRVAGHFDLRTVDADDNQLTLTPKAHRTSTLGNRG
jgi:hypothetical protein